MEQKVIDCNLDPQVLKDAVRMLEKAARIVESLRFADTATEANRLKVRARLSVAHANINAAQVRIPSPTILD